MTWSLIFLFIVCYACTMINDKEEIIESVVEDEKDLSNYDEFVLAEKEKITIVSTESSIINKYDLKYIQTDFKNVLKNIDKLDMSYIENEIEKKKIKTKGIILYKDKNNKIIKDLRDKLVFEKYAIAVNRKKFTTTIYGYENIDEEIYYTPLVSFPCSANYTLTRKGEFLTGEKYRWHLMIYDEYAQFCTRFDGRILFHSALYRKSQANTLLPDTYNGILTKKQSSGCIRLRAIDAKYIYEKIPESSVVVVYDGNLDSPFGRPTFDMIEYEGTPSEIDCFDPTDTL